MRRLTLTKMLAAVAAAALIAAFASAASKHPAASSADRAPAFCRGDDVKQIVTDFISAFNRGDRDDLQLLWVRIRFQWYAVHDTRPAEPYSHIEYTRNGTLQYFADRHARGERLQLAEYQYVAFNAAWGHFNFRVRRKAPDLRGGRSADYVGAGTVSCLKGPVGLGRWTMAQIA